MSKILLTLSFVLLSQTSFAGLLPYEWYVCKAQGVTTDGVAVLFSGAGIHATEASENAMYFCTNEEGISNCEVTSCTSKVVRPRP